MNDIIIVKYTNDFWNASIVKKTDAKNGLGWSYLPTSQLGGISIQPDEIVFNRNVLVNMRLQLQQEIGFWNGRPAVAPAGAPNRRRGFGRRLYDILFIGNTRSNEFKDAYWGNNPSALGDLDQFERRTKIYQILNSHISLITQILNLAPTLSRTPPTAPPPSDLDSTLVSVGTTTKDVAFTFITIETVEVPLNEIIQDITNQLVIAKTAMFFDPAREYKTVLNLGNDQQYLIEAWRQGSFDTSIQLKLRESLDSTVNIDDSGYLVREIANSIIDTVEIELPPEVDTSKQLRPYNSQVARTNTTRNVVNNFTLASVPTDGTVYTQWYTYDFNSSELNIDFTDYNNFVMFGSAEMRLAAFKNKLIKMSASNAATTEEYIRNFDPYEQYLYHATETVPYSASAYYADSGVEFNTPAFWPKSGSLNEIESVNGVTGSLWFATQSAIARRFDEYNPNYLIKHLPVHIQEDENSQEFLTFVAMVGHVMDNLKVYIDQFPNIYSTSPDPLDELTMDQVYEVATSFGFKLPNAYALEQLQEFVSTVYNSSGGNTLLKETWKRFIHSAMYLSKAKGTKTAIDGIMNVYGINSPLIQLKESGYPTRDSYVQSDELSYGVRFTPISGSIQIPLVSGSLSTDTFQMRFIPSDKLSRTVVNGDANWAVDLVPHPSASKELYGRLHVVSGSLRTLVATSSYFPLFSQDYTHIMLRSQSQNLMIVQTDGDQILHQEIISSGIPSVLWNSTEFVYVGGSGSIQLSTFNGIVDEIHTWNETISDAAFIKQAYDPGAYYGSSYSSSLNNLYVHIGFSQPLHDITSSAVNESPYVGASSIPLPTIGFTTGSYERILRPVKQFVPTVGATSYMNSKVTVAPPPVFSGTSLDPDGVPTLSNTNSIKPLAEKQFIGGQDIVTFAISPLDFVNQNIMRTMGTVNTNYLIGSPRKIQGERYPELDELYDFYRENYGKYINPNEYIRFFKNVIYGPSEQVESMIPARAALVDGVVIESNILSRKRNATLRSFRVDGSGTTTFISLVNSASNATTNSLAGAYSFDATYTLYPEQESIVIPENKQVYQLVNPSDTIASTSSLASDGSAIAYVESNISVEPTTADSEHAYYEGTATYIAPQGTQTGYPRAPFVGIPRSELFPALLDSEENTVTPFYDIPPRSDFNDVGTTTYFHLPSGVYRFPSLLKKGTTEVYLAKFIENRASPLDQVYAPIGLFPPTTVPNVPSRETISLGEQRYEAGATVNGTIKLAKLLSLIGVEGATGLRVVLTNETDNSVIFDAVLDGDSDVNPYLLLQTERGSINYTITNTTGTAIVSEVIFDYFTYDALPLIPQGYLPRHYRFSKSTSTPNRRRKYLGSRKIYCENTCPPGITESSDTRVAGIIELPFEIEFTKPTDNTVPPTPGNGPVTFGGFGPLDI
jgi:hypothetical protein